MWGLVFLEAIVSLIHSIGIYKKNTKSSLNRCLRRITSYYTHRGTRDGERETGKQKGLARFLTLIYTGVNLGGLLLRFFFFICVNEMKRKNLT